MNDEPPGWVSAHALTVGHYYHTNDADLTLEYIGFAQIRDDHGFRIVMVFRDLHDPEMLLTLGESDADACAGFTPLGDHFLGELRPGD